ncbi:hypothetical protein AB9D74_25945, partial [Klebsiella pneumoniae]
AFSTLGVMILLFQGNPLHAASLHTFAIGDLWAMGSVLPGFVYQLGNLLASVNATLQASIAQHHEHNYGLAMALVAGTVAIVITVLTFFGREGRVIQSAGAGHHQPLSTSR